jgi:hypothetical protein
MVHAETRATGRQEEVATSDHDTSVARGTNVASAAAVLSSTGTATILDDIDTATVVVTGRTTTTTAITYRQFWRQFTTARGAVELLVISTIFAVGIGSVLGLVRYRCVPQQPHMFRAFLTHTHIRFGYNNCCVGLPVGSRHASGSVCAPPLWLCRSV